MSSLIPKISVGIDSRKYRRNQSCLVHGTSEIGFVFPTYARNYINDASVSLGTRSRVMLSSMFVPTMGQMDVRHYHCFVPWNRVWSPFDAFLAKEPFNFRSGSSIPYHVPSMRTGELLVGLFQRDSLPVGWNARGNVYNAGGCSFDEWINSNALNVGLTCAIYKANSVDGLPGTYELATYNVGNTNNSILNFCFSTGNNDVYGYELDGETSGHVGTLIPSMIRTTRGDFFIECASGSNFAQVTGISSIGAGYRSHRGLDYINSLSYPTIDNCDFSYELQRTDGSGNVSFYMVCFNFNGAIKRLRNIFLGLGYSFNPYDMENDSVLKLFAFYRAWFSMFAVTRDMNFNDTNCAKLFRLMSEIQISYPMRVYGDDNYYDSSFQESFYGFLKDLCDLTYTCPADYFTSSVTNVNKGASQVITISGGDAQSGTDLRGSGAGVGPDSAVAAKGYTTGGTPYVNALSIEIARRLLTWINKNTVVGKKISDILYSRYGKIQTNDDSSEGVYKIGVDTVPITIDQIFNQTSSENSAPLGERSGIGQGGKRAPKHSFTTPAYGVLITLTAVVPEMGYFQGKLRENSDGVNDSLEFPDTAYDAVGWQNVRYNELVADRQFARYLEPDSYGTSLGNYGKQMRYSHYKVGFNRVLGDVSLPHMRDSMLPYTLDRYFDPRDYNLPVNNPIVSRRGDIGGTNRIFDVVAPTDDHIIYQIYFDISVNDRLKPLGLSYDTILDNDDKTVDFGHQ